MKRKYDLSWRGRLTIENTGEIVNLFVRLLEGNEFILVTTYGNSAPDIVKNVTVDHGRFQDKAAISSWSDKEQGRAGVTISTTQEVLHLYTNLREGVIDKTRQGPYVTFQGDRVTVSYKSGGGISCHWQAVIMEEDELLPKVSSNAKEMTLEEFLAEIRAFDIEPRSAEAIEIAFKEGRAEIKCAEYPYDDIRLQTGGGRAKCFLAGGYPERKELSHLEGVIISDLVV